MTRPGSTHVSGCTCTACTANGVIQVVIPNAPVVTTGGTGGGVQGPQGVQGRQGIQGAHGVQGAQGLTGAGVQGATGTQGAQGLQGNTGAGLQGTQGLQGATGLDGTQGIAGAQLESTDDLAEGTTNLYYTPERASYRYAQNVASDTWNITHNLGFYPNITVQDSANSTVEGEITHQSVNSVQLTFSAAFSGVAYLS